jgi:CheY-like chemotaxis protein
MVVDDDPLFRRAVCNTLQRAGFDVVSAHNGREALDLLRDTTVDLTVLDIFMPEVDGMELTVRIMEQIPDARIVAMSGGGVVGAEGALEIAVRFGAVRTLAKPFSTDELLQAVAEVLEKDA